MDWVRVPCDLTSTGYGVLMNDANGAQHLGVFLALIEIVAALPITVRDGRLINAKAIPLSFAALGIKSRIPETKIAESVAALIDCGWLITDGESLEIPGGSGNFPENPGGEGKEEGDGEAKNICSSGDERERDSSLTFTEGEKPKASPSGKRIGTPEQAQWFEKFWSAYWRKQARKPALAAFCKAVKTAEQFAAVMAAIAAQSPEMLRREPQHRPHAATWLNHERWNDPATESRRDPILDAMYEGTTND